MLFGRVVPNRIPESWFWWKTRQTELVVVSDDHELGQVTSMVTITQNNLAPEFIASASACCQCCCCQQETLCANTPAFGRVDPRHIPESGSWWKTRPTELMGVSDDHELGQMTSMVTVTQNDLAPALIAHARRGPCALPTLEEKFAYFLTRRAPSDRRTNIQEDSTAAVLS